jgi:hypothetical protein
MDPARGLTDKSHLSDKSAEMFAAQVLFESMSHPHRKADAQSLILRDNFFSTSDKQLDMFSKQ